MSRRVLQLLYKKTNGVEGKKEGRKITKPTADGLWCWTLKLAPITEELQKFPFAALPVIVRAYSGSAVKMMDDKLNLCPGSEGEL